ncbi:MAG: S9 family peptidase [Burkholderiales bacterium]|nr:S9 family peptidase [Burkholderiales bacterium]
MSTITHRAREFVVARFLRITSAISCALTVLSVSAQSPAAPAVATPATAVAYKTAADIPVADFFRLPRYSQMAISPDGKRVAALAPVNGRDNIAVIDLEKRSAVVITRFDRTDIVDLLWVDGNRIVFRTANRELETGVPQFQAAFAVDADGANLRNLTPDKRQRGFRVFRPTHDGTGDLIIGRFVDSRTSSSVLRLDTRTGRATSLTFKNPGEVSGWAIDSKNQVRGALRVEPRESADAPRKRSLWVRATGDGDWEKIHESGDELEALLPLAFDTDDKTLIVSSRAGGDRSALYRFDIATRKLGEKLFEHPWLDINGGLVRHPKTQAVLGVRYSAEVPRTHWFDETYAALQKAVDSALTSTTNTLFPGDESSRTVVVFAQSATDAGTYYLLNTEKRALERVAATREWLPSTLMPERKFVAYKSRDGMTIPAWLTVPRGVEAKNLPLIVHIHGGPWARGYHGVQWGRWPSAQFFASRGYAVLEPEPRASTGFGRKHYRSGFKQWGLTMQDDITDGALHLAKEGIVNKDRMCLFGGSYGGYASLQGLVKDPDLWRCASSYIAVTDLELLQTVAWSDIARGSDFYETDYKFRVGDYEKDRAQFDATSPAKNAAKIKAAVMLTMGGQDQRVPLIHGTAMRDAMEKAGKPLDYKVYVDEAHGFNANENVTDFYTRTEAFFAKHLKP